MSQDTFARRRLAFGARAELYDRARPSYPPEAARWLLGSTPLRVIDLGAGTGIFSRVLAALGHHVTAVEPDPEMRAQLLARGGIDAIDGSAESIPLDDGCVDAVVAAQAFHWFDNDTARAEIARVLVSRGVFGAVWNTRDESVGWIAELARIVAPGTGVTAGRHAAPGRDFGELFTEPERAEFRHAVRQTADGLLDLAHSRSAYLTADEAERRRIDSGLEELTRGLPEWFDVPHLTVVFRMKGRLVGAVAV